MRPREPRPGEPRGPGERVTVERMTTSTWSITLIGSLAALCTTLAFVPQVVRVWRLGRAEEISVATFLLFSFGTAAWFVYGLFLDSWPIILANAATLVLALILVTLTLKLGRDRSASTP